MDMNTVIRLCKDIGKVKKFKENKNVFGNIELEIETPHKTLLSIISDRGDFSCYVIKKILLYNKPVSIKNIIEKDQDISFNSLESAINYLKNNLKTIEKG